MKRIRWASRGLAGLVGLLLLFAAACGQPGAGSGGSGDGAATGGEGEGERVARIAVVQATTGGSGALYGTEERNGAFLAAEEINASGMLGDIRIEPIHYDDAADRSQTVNIFQKAINQDRVLAILGPTLSNSAFAADPIAQDAGVPVIAASNTAPGITDIGDYIFRTSPPEDSLFPGVLEAVREKYGIERVAQLYGIDDQLMKAAYDVHKAAIEAQGLEIVATESFQKGDTDFSAQLTNIKAADPDAIILASLAEEAANTIRQARQLGIPDDVVFVGANAVISTKLFELAGEAANGTIVGAGWYAEYPTEKNKAFVAAYEAKYGHKPDTFAAQAYDAMYVLADAIKRAGTVTDRAKLRDAIAATEIEGVVGPFSFTPKGDPVIEPKVLVARDGRFEPLE